MLKRLRLAGETWWADVALGAMAGAACLAMDVRPNGLGVAGDYPNRLQ